MLSIFSCIYKTKQVKLWFFVTVKRVWVIAFMPKLFVICSKMIIKIDYEGRLRKLSRSNNK